ncbi:MAG TPA: PhnD/SsuA/transferrin family substrate-binding protein [Rubrobacteraceae bacterium]|nr:PhnD/SsuA/transferrin family substrate-binding protein [Rubrobacteraceae bacterium]
MKHKDIGALPELRFITYLSPSLPLELFEAVVDHVRRHVGCRASLRAETSVSGPRRGAGDPFSRGEADVAFVCSPSYAWLRELEPPPAELLGVAPVFRDRRNGGRPLYFCEVIVRRDAPVRSFMDLKGGSWAYNDRCSLSGYHGLLKKLTEMGTEQRFFGRLIRSGSHLKSLEMVAQGAVDAASIDSNVLALRLRARPELRRVLRVAETWGPFPVQPVIVRSALGTDLKKALREGFLTVDSNPRARRVLAEFGLERFDRVSRETYESERLTAPSVIPN